MPATFRVVVALRVTVLRREPVLEVDVVLRVAFFLALRTTFFLLGGIRQNPEEKHDCSRPKSGRENLAQRTCSRFMAANQ